MLQCFPVTALKYITLNDIRSLFISLLHSRLTLRFQLYVSLLLRFRDQLSFLRHNAQM